MLSGDRARNHPALTDAATGLANRLQFDLVYDYLYLAGLRGLSFTVMVASAGLETDDDEQAVRDLAHAIDQRTRTADLVCHIGEGRFVALLVGTNLQGARIVADRIESAWESAPGPVSFGVVAFAKESTGPVALLTAARAALLEAEGNGGGVEFG